MATTMHTVEGHTLSTADRSRVGEFTDRVRATDGLPEGVRDGLAAVLDLVADGHDIAMFDTAAHLSPNEAARLVGVSRPLLNQILDEGRISFFETAGGHRKIKLAAARAYIEERDSVAAQLAAVRAQRKPDNDIIAIDAPVATVEVAGTNVDRARLAELCGRYGIAELSVFGSVARGEHRPDSDLDLLYELAPGQHLGFSINRLQDELTELFDRPVDLVSESALHPALRPDVLAEARVLHVA